MAFETDIYKSEGDPLCYRYCNSNVLFLNKQEDKLVLEKNTISSNQLVEQFFNSTDKLDLNGKLCVDSIRNFEDLYLRNPSLPVKVNFKTDDLKNSYWVLSKSDIKKTSINYSFLIPVKKNYELKLIENISKNSKPVFFNLDSKTFVLGYESSDDQLMLKLLNW